MKRTSKNTGKAPAFQFYARDWLTDRTVRQMGALVRGYYIDLLCHQWLDGPLPRDQNQTRILLNVDEKTWAKVWPAISKKFPIVHGKRLNRRLEEVRKERVNYHEKKRLAGAKGGQKSGEARRQAKGKQTRSSASSKREANGKPASATASASARDTTPPPSSEEQYPASTPPAASALLGRMADPRERDQVARFFAEMPPGESLVAWAGVLTGCLDGLMLSQGKACTTTQLAAGCAAYLVVVKGNPWSERLFRRVVEDYMREPRPELRLTRKDDDDPFAAVTEELRAQERRAS